MNDYISRQAAIQLALDGKIISTDMEKCVRDFINELPAADVQPIKRGHWNKKHRHRGGYRQATGKTKVFGEILTITIDERYEIDDLYCSECGKLNESVFTNFCPNCGADMRGGKPNE